MSLASVSKGRSDRQLLKDLQHLVHRDHKLESELIAILGEVDARRLYLEQAHPSMFQFCVSVLHFAEGVAYKRIAVARAARKHPELLRAVEAGELHLTAASLIAPHLTDENTADWLACARHRTAQEIRHQIADRKPKSDVQTSVRRVPNPRRTARPVSGAGGVGAKHDARLETAGATSAALFLTGVPTAHLPSLLPDPFTPPTTREPEEPRKGRCEPLGAERYSIRFVADREAHAQLQELRCLLRSSIPDGDVAKILTRAIGVLLEQVRKQKIASCSSPRPARASSGNREAKNPSRHIPAAIRREVWKRDGGRCTFRSRTGRQCGSLQYLEFHHQVPWARCREHTTSNIALRCRGHNQYEAELVFGSEPMARFRKGSAEASAVSGIAVDVGKGVVIGVGEGDRTALGNLRSQLDLIPVH